MQHWSCWLYISIIDLNQCDIPCRVQARALTLHPKRETAHSNKHINNSNKQQQQQQQQTKGTTATRDPNTT